LLGYKATGATVAGAMKTATIFVVVALQPQCYSTIFIAMLAFAPSLLMSPTMSCNHWPSVSE